MYSIFSETEDFEVRMFGGGVTKVLVPINKFLRLANYELGEFEKTTVPDFKSEEEAGIWYKEVVNTYESRKSEFNKNIKKGFFSPSKITFELPKQIFILKTFTI